MKITGLKNAALAATLAILSSSASALVVNSSNDATALANTLGGAGIVITNAALSTASSTGAGIFSGGAASIGFDSGVLLTTGTVNCAPGPNTQASCTGSGTSSSLSFDFTTTTGNIFFNYVFASEEYNEYVNSSFNDTFALLLNGVNIALLPNGDTVSINNVNNGSNATFYRDNTVLGLNTQFDGLTTILTASATGLTGTNSFEFRIQDVGDANFDSGVFIQASTFSAEPPKPSPVPEPATTALFGLGMLGFAVARRKSLKSKID